MVNPHRSLLLPSNKWPTVPFLHYIRATFVGEDSRHKRRKHKTEVGFGKRENRSLGSQADLRAGSCKVNSRVVYRALGNEWQDIVEEPLPSQTKEHTTNDWRAGAVGAPATSGGCLHRPEEEMIDNTPMCYSRRATLRREQCNMAA
jgi:hypothetical protein